MAQEASEASVASSSPTPNWWEMHANPVSSWNAINRSWQQPHPNALVSSNCDDHDISISISATNSGLSMDSSSADLSGEPTENHLWNQVLFVGRGGGGGLHGGHDGGGSFLEGLSSTKSLATEMFDPACDYLKKLDHSSWEFTNHLPVLNSLEKHLSGYNSGGCAMIEPERMASLSDLVSNWSIAPPNPNPSMTQYSMSNISQIKHEIPNNTQSYPDVDMGFQGDHLVSVSVSEPSLLRPIHSDNIIGYGLNNPFTGLTDAPWSSSGRNLSDLISFGSSLSKPAAMEFRATTKPSVKGTISSESSDSKKQGHETSSSTKRSGRINSGTSQGKKKRSEDMSSDTVLLKKSKHESSNASSLVKLQAPKVKLGDRINALQQIVSPFGKTDTASVLLEAIKYIRFLQEQVQLLSDPYMKSSSNKDHNSWGVALERKDMRDSKLDLASRGLCLVPISCTPQIYRENTGPDYWTPTYRGCLYR